MDEILRPPQLDELGLPLRPSNRGGDEDISDEMMQRLMAGDFSDLNLPKPSSFPTAAEAQAEARERSTEILSSWDVLRQILERHEDLIRRRWMKKTKKQRTAIILEAWPNMSRSHRPDYEAMRRETPAVIRAGGTRFREAYMWPDINIEDMVKGKTLLLLLNSRGRNTPQTFAHADFAAIRLGHASGACMPPFLNLHTMLLEGETVRTYGRIVSWDDDEDAMMKTFNGLGFLPGAGLQVLEIQQKLLGFLLNCSHSLLHDINPKTMISEATIKPEPSPLSDDAEYPTLATIAAEAPYRLPAGLDFNRLKALVNAKRSSVEDHIRSLREDPGYFADFLGDWSEHRQEKVLDINGKRHPILGEPLFWERVIGNVITDAYGGLVVWNIISEQLTHLASLQKKYSNSITPTKPLPPEYLKALLTFRYTLEQSKKGPILQLKNGVPASPYYRSTFVREPHVPGSNMIRLRNKTKADYLMWLFNNLWTDEQLTLLTLPGLMDEIEHHIQSDPNVKAKISSWVARIFAELGLIARIRHELDIYQPWASGFDHGYVDYRDEIEKDFPRRFAGLAEIQNNYQGLSVAKFGSPTEGRFHYPSDKRRTQLTTQSMRKAEGNLDLFWEKIDGHYRRKIGKSLDQTVEHIFTEARGPLERTPEWIEPAKEPQKSTTQLSTTQSDLDLNHHFASTHLESKGISKFVPPQPKVKSKTRGPVQDNTAAIDEVVPALVPAEDEQPVFRLKKRALKVFKALFYNASQSDLPGEIQWSDFLFAMAATGFAPEKLYGSVWQFTPSGLDVERSIQFHEPHPVAKIPFRNARRIGRRLSRTYGWHGAMFTME